MQKQSLLSKGTDGDWLPAQHVKANAHTQEPANPGPTIIHEPNPDTSSVAGNVTSFINGIRASLKSENVVAPTSVKE